MQKIRSQLLNSNMCVEAENDRRSRVLRSKPRARLVFPLTTRDKRTAARPAYRGCEQQGCSLVLIGLRLRYAYQGPRAAIRSIMAGCAVQDRPNSAHSRVRISKRPKIHTRSKFSGRRKVSGGTESFDKSGQNKHKSCASFR